MNAAITAASSTQFVPLETGGPRPRRVAPPRLPTLARSATVLVMMLMPLGGQVALAAFAPTVSSPSIVNSNAATDTLDDKAPRIANDGCTWVAVWESDENLSGAGTDKDIFVARSTNYGDTWTTVATLNTNATTDTGDDSRPWIKTDGSGNWVTVWRSVENLSGAGTDEDIFVSRSTDNGATWTAPALLNSNATTDTGNDDRPIVETDGSGNWVATWESAENLGSAGTDEDIFVARSTDNGATWTAAALLNSNATTDTGTDRASSLVTDQSGNWVVVWRSNEDFGGAGVDADVFVSRSTDNGATWTAVALLNSTATTDTAAEDDKKPIVETDGSGNWVAVWESDANVSSAGADTDIFVSRSTDNGTTWTAVALLNSTAATDGAADDDKEPSLETDGAGSWVVVWNSNDDLAGAGVDDDIFVAQSTDNGATWSTVDTLNTNATTDSGNDKKPFILTDRANSWIVVWESDDTLVGKIGMDSDILRATFVLTEISTCEYVERLQSWSATSADAWQTQDLTGLPFNVPPSAVAEIAVRNSDVLNALSGGVRAVGSTLERRLTLHAPQGGGDDALVMHVQTDTSSQIQHYSDDTAQVDFVLLGYWDCGTYVEAFDTFTAGANASWQDQNLCSFGVGPANVAEIAMTNDDTLFEREAGVRTNGSVLERRLDLHKAEGGGVDAGTLFVKAEVSGGATVELYAEDDVDVDFYLVGYWSTAPLAYTELYADAGSPSTDATWEDLDLTASGVSDDAIVEFAMSNEFATQLNSMGIRSNGSCLSRTIELHEAEGGGGDFYRAHVVADSTASIEFYHQDVSDLHTFRVVGQWTPCSASISYVISDLGAVTPANSSLGISMNASGDVAGFDEDGSGNADAWFSECGAFTALGTLGGADGEALGLNDAETVVGWSLDGSGNRKAFSWTSGGGLVDLGTTASRADSEATAINASSEVVGLVSDFTTSAANRLAFINLPAPAYTLGAGMTSLGTFGGDQSVAMDINDSGQVVGGAENTADLFRPFRWANGTMTDLGTLGGENGAIEHRGQAINSAGNVVGLSYTAGGDAHAFFWDGSMTDIGVLTGGSTSWAFDINNSDVVVGTSEVTGAVFRAFVWDATNGLRDLNDLDGASGWTLSRATSINADGEITGFGTNPSSNVRAFLLTPTCGSGGGGAAALSLAPTESSPPDGTGDQRELFTFDDRGLPLDQVNVQGLLGDSTFEVSRVPLFDNVSSGPAMPVTTLAGLLPGTTPPHTLIVDADSEPGSAVFTIRMSIAAEELRNLGVMPQEVMLMVLDTQDEASDLWVPAGRHAGEVEPTGRVGDSGFVFIDDDNIDYWAVRDRGGLFTVGAPKPIDPDAAAPLPSMCGAGVVLPGLVVMGMLCSCRRRRAPSRRCVPRTKAK